MSMANKCFFSYQPENVVNASKHVRRFQIFLLLVVEPQRHHDVPSLETRKSNHYAAEKMDNQTRVHWLEVYYTRYE